MSRIAPEIARLILVFSYVTTLLILRAAREGLIGGTTTSCTGAIGDPVCRSRPVDSKELIDLTFVADRSDDVLPVAVGGVRTTCAVRRNGDRTLVSIP